MKLKNWFTKFSLIIFGCLAGLLFIEIFLRLVDLKTLQAYIRIMFGEKLRDCLIADPFLNHKLKPNCQGIVRTREYEIALQTNSLGLREKEIKEEKEAGVYRILIVGDSYAEGWGVREQERFDHQAKQYLQEQNKKGLLKKDPAKIEFINAGIRSYSPILELEYLKSAGLQLKPDLVILFYDLSDLHDDFYYGGWPKHQKLKEETLPNTPDYFQPWPQDDETELVKSLRQSKIFAAVYDQLKTSALNKEKKFSLVNLGTDISLFAKAESWPDYDKIWRLNIANLYLVHDFLNQNGVDFSVAVVPRGNYINPMEWDEGREVLGIKRRVKYNPEPIKIIESAMTERGIKIVDLLTPLSSGLNDLYYLYDPHWTKLGNRVVGEALGKFIVEKIEAKGK